MDQQALSNTFMRSFHGIQANSSEVANVQDSSNTTNVTEKADFSEYKGKFDMLLMSGMAEAIKIWLCKIFFLSFTSFLQLHHYFYDYMTVLQKL